MATRNEAPALMAIHPGSILKEELIERGISQKDFAKMISMQPSHLSEIIKGKRSITKPVADKLEEVLGIPSIDWVNLQIGFEYDTQQNAERQIAEMAAYNTLQEYLRYFDVRTLEEIEYSKYLYAFVDVNRYYFAVFNDKNTIILAIKPTDEIIKEFSKYEL